MKEEVVFINGTKQCKICKKWFPDSTDYFYKHNTNKDGLFPYCKSCSKEKSWMRQKKNLNKHYELQRKYYHKKPEMKERKRRESKSKRERGIYKEWQQSNKDKIKSYTHRIHEISNQEWESCKTYFNFECAYCGISETEAKEKYNNYLHKEHVEHNGKNNLSNCVPACKICNSEKRISELEDWYNDLNPKFDKNKLNKIHKWLNEDYKSHIKSSFH